MPEGLEIELYRLLAEEHARHRPIVGCDAPDAWFLKRGLDAAALSGATVGTEIGSARRIGKLLLLDLVDPGSRGASELPTDVLGLRFGMTGRLLVDGQAGIEHLEYSSPRDLPAWDRLVLHFEDGGELRLRDPRRLGGVELDPDESRLGPDAMKVTLRQVRMVLADSSAPVKARLLDQQRVAGLGNLLVDEVLWRASIDPSRPAGGLTDDEVRRLHRTIRATLPQLLRRGGSHTGDLMPARARGTTCPRDGAPVLRRTIGGRTTYSCSVHQR